MKKWIRDMIMHGFSYLLALLAWIIPKKKDLVLFGAFNGTYFGDNTGILFQFILKKHPELRVIWLTNSSTVIQEVKQLGGEAYKRRSLQGIFLSLICPVYLTSHSIKDVLMFVPIKKRPKHIYLHHGIPLRKGWLDLKNAPKSAIRSTYEKIRATNFMIAPSEFAAQQQNKLIPIGIDKFKITGLPRNDVFLDTSLDLDAVKKKLALDTFQKRILYAPTWRPWGATRFFPFPDTDLPMIHRFLEEQNMSIILRPHHIDLNKMENQAFWETIKGMAHFKLIDHNTFQDVNILCRISDALITDYSSLYYDYLLCDQPVIFLDYDFEQYNREIGFYCDYPEITIGYKPKNQKAFLEALFDIYEGKDPFQEKRDQFKHQFHQFTDVHSSERVTQLLKSLSA